MRGVDVTVLIPVRDRAEMLRQCLWSVTGQATDLRIQVVVIDDSSSDDSAAVAKDFGVDLVCCADNVGTARARNLGLERARGTWVAFLDSDDWWAHDHLETLWAGRGHGVMASTSALVVIDGNRRVVGTPSLRTAELHRPCDVFRPENAVALSAAMARADVVTSIGGFAPRTYAEDLDLWLRLLRYGTGHLLPRITVGYRSHTTQTSREPGMGPAVQELLEEAAAEGILTPRHVRALAATDVWDARPSSSPAWVLRALRTGRLDPSSLAWLLTSRASQRHRWRLQWYRLSELHQPPAGPGAVRA
jgi:cellulose synthase/poly-beta-1,6-N-acetylglucosamine synthase-like glycosyltransferase